MRKILFILLILVQNFSCLSQEKINGFVSKFKLINLPLENIGILNCNDTLNGKFTNDIIIRNQKSKPHYFDKNGNLKIVEHYYGLYPEEPFSYGYNDQQLLFYSKIVPIGSISLNSDYKTLIIKVIDFETTFYDLWSFSEDGKALSVLCLYWGMRDAGPRNEKVTFIVVDSKITKDGEIIWHENSHGLETFRTYRLNKNGCFQIIKEEKKGVFEF